MKTLSLAFRNLMRNKRRSLMTLFAMILGLVTVLLFGGYIRDLNYGLQTDFVQLTGHLQIQRKDYFRFGSGNPAAYGVENYERVIEAIKRDQVLAPMLAVVTPILQFGGIAGNFSASVSRTVYVTGTVVEDQNRMRAWNDYAFPSLSRRLSLSGTPSDSAVIGTGVARVLKLCSALGVSDCSTESPKAEDASPALPDDIAELSSSTASAPNTRKSPEGKPRIEILATGARGAPNVAGVNVLSAEFQGLKEFDDVYVGVHLSLAQKLVFGAAPPQVTAIAIQLKHTSQLESAQEKLRQILSSEFKAEPLEILDYETLNPYYGQALSMFAAIFGFISVLIGAIVLFTVSNTMSMAVVERTAEIGTLRAIGLRRSGIRAIFVTEGIGLGVLGSALGVAAALGLAWIINFSGLTWLPPGHSERIPLAIRLAGEYRMMMLSAVGLIAVAALSAVFPASRAARMNIVEALRHA
ncbi:MAG: FtsX-like permease family protein [Burkholderiaceae bacterium]|nr:FtsX-like permease family protein [Burkholderiaceae bacterium]